MLQKRAFAASAFGTPASRNAREAQSSAVKATLPWLVASTRTHTRATSLCSCVALRSALSAG
jgi:hypothetical protein